MTLSMTAQSEQLSKLAASLLPVAPTHAKRHRLQHLLAIGGLAENQVASTLTLRDGARQCECAGGYVMNSSQHFAHRTSTRLSPSGDGGLPAAQQRRTLERVALRTRRNPTPMRPHSGWVFQPPTPCTDELPYQGPGQHHAYHSMLLQIDKICNEDKISALRHAASNGLLSSLSLVLPSPISRMS